MAPVKLPTSLDSAGLRQVVYNLAGVWLRTLKKCNLDKQIGSQQVRDCFIAANTYKKPGILRNTLKEAVPSVVDAMIAATLDGCEYSDYVVVI